MVDWPSSINSAAASASRVPRPRAQTTGTIRRTMVALAFIVSDAVVAIATVGLTTVLPIDTTALIPAILALVPLLFLIHGALGLYVGGRASPIERLRLRTWGGLVLAAAIAALMVTTKSPAVQIAQIPVLACAIILLGYIAEGFTRRVLIRADLWCAPAAIVGCEATARRLAAALQEQPDLGFRPVGFISDGTPERTELHDLPLPLLGTLQGRVTSDIPIEAGLIALEGGLAGHASRCSALPFPYLISVQGSEETQSLWLQTRPLGISVGVETRRELLLPGNLLLKRGLDLALALPSALLMLPVFGVIALLIQAIDPGSPLYAQPRIGQNGRLIRVLKFRTMYRDAEDRLESVLLSDQNAAAEWEKHLKLSNDPRILPIVGRLFRRASLDELPQLWNVIRGEMSLVGPRPFPAYHIQRFDGDFQKLRSSVVPGLTGFWQISSRSNGDLSKQKAEDIFYISNWSIWLDLYILLKTLPAVLSGKGAK